MRHCRCRLEQWGHLCTMGIDNMEYSNEGKLEPLDSTPDDHGSDWYIDSIMVLEGDYTNPDSAQSADLVS